jgi:TolB-like protein
MIRESKALFIPLFCLLELLLPLRSQAQCHQTADLSAMTGALSTWQNELSAGSKDRVAVMPFRDNVAVTPDAALALSIPYLLADAFGNASPNLIVPEVIAGILNAHSADFAVLDDPQSAAKLAERAQARFVIFGSVQRADAGRVRVILNIYDAQRKLALSPAVNFWTVMDAGFVPSIIQGAQDGFAQLKATRTLKQDPNYHVPSFTAFRYDIKGRLLDDLYNPNRLQLAAVWFGKALREDFLKFDDAAIGLAKVEFMLALIAKNQKKPYTAEWQAAHQALDSVSKGHQTGLKAQSATRFSSAHASFGAGLIAYRAGNFGAALSQAEAGLALVPEDGQLQNLYLLSAANVKITTKTTTRNPVCF